jgi:hypothetical protein
VGRVSRENYDRPAGSSIFPGCSDSRHGAPARVSFCERELTKHRLDSAAVKAPHERDLHSRTSGPTAYFLPWPGGVPPWPGGAFPECPGAVSLWPGAVPL